MKQLRSVLFWAHLVTGVFVAAVVLIMSVTGVLLTYQRQITAWADTRGMDAGPPAPGAARLGPEAILAAVRAVEAEEPGSVRWHADPDRPVEVSWGREKRLFVSAYTGAVLGEGNAGVREFFRVVVGWHRWLGAEGERRDLARAITGAANLGFLFLVLSGLFLWWPRNRTRARFRNVLVFRRGLSAKARDFNWHNVIGFWTAIPLAIVVASAVVISYPWASDLVYRLAGDAPAERGRGPGGAPPADPPAEGTEPAMLGLDVLAARAERQAEGWRSITLQLGDPADAPVSFSVDRGDGGQPQKRAQLALDPATGQVVRWETFGDNTPGRRARSVLRFAHTGEVAGIVGQTIAGVVSFAAVVLVWTGLALALRRLGGWRRRRADPPAVPRRPRKRRAPSPVR